VCDQDMLADIQHELIFKGMTSFQTHVYIMIQQYLTLMTWSFMQHHGWSSTELVPRM